MRKLDIDGPILIKFAPLKRAKSFISGIIYMNTLDFFRGLEDSHKGQGDLFEGVDSIIAKEDFREVAAYLGMTFPKNIVWL